MSDAATISAALGNVQAGIAERERDLKTLYAQRLGLFVAARELDPPMKHREIAAAAGIEEEAVTKALSKARAAARPRGRRKGR